MEHQGVPISTNRTPKSTNEHQQRAIQKSPTRTNIAQQGAPTSINRPQQWMSMSTTKSQQWAPAKHGKKANEHQESKARKLFKIPIEHNKLMLIATTTKQAKNKNLSFKLHALELLITLFYMEKEKGKKKKRWQLCLCNTIGNPQKNI